MAQAVDRVTRARFRISAADQGALLQWRARLATAGTDLETALERAFAGIGSPDEVLVIDRLEVDLGDLVADDLELDRLVAATRDALERAVAAAPLRDGPPPARAAPQGEASQDRRPFRVPLSQSAMAALVSYLATGRLGPRAPVDSLAALYAAITPDAAAGAALRRFLARASATAMSAALLRLLATARPSLAHALIARAFPDSPSVADALTAQGAPSQPDGVKPPDRAAAEETTNVTPQSLKRTAEAAASRIRETLARQDGRDTPEPVPVDTPAPDETQPCANAGMVLLHPFLAPYFEGIGLVRDRDFIDEGARATAARLLHALATGDTQPDEPDLVLPRLLCAVPDDLPLLALEPLEPEHLDEGQRLMQAFLAAWTGIGHATAEGIRDSFLRRGGVLGGLPDAPRLTIERSGIDILLTRLPWTLSVIRLPWMTTALKVDWT